MNRSWNNGRNNNEYNIYVLSKFLSKRKYEYVQRRGDRLFFHYFVHEKGNFYFNTLKLKQIIYGMINFIPSFREPFPLSRITASNIMLMFLIKIYIT